MQHPFSMCPGGDCLPPGTPPGDCLQVVCAANGALTLTRWQAGQPECLSGHPWAIPLPDVSVACLQVEIDPATPARLVGLLYCELGRIAAGRLALATPIRPFDGRGRFRACDYLQLVWVDRRPGRAQARWVFEVCDATG